MKSIAKLNLLDSKNISDVSSYTTATSSFQLEFASLDDMKFSSEWEKKYSKFNYNYNKFGFRMDSDEIPSTTDIGIFGCSYCAGLGLPVDMLWHTLLAKQLNMSHLNFAMNGLSPKSIIDLFLIISKHVTMKHAILVLSPYMRLQIAKINAETHKILYMSSAQSTDPMLKKYKVDVESLYKGTPEEDMYKNLRNDIYLAEKIAKERNIKIYLSAWDGNTYEFLKHMDLTSAVIIPQFGRVFDRFYKQYTETDIEKDLARDKSHLGPIHHEYWAEKTKEYIK